MIKLIATDIDGTALCNNDRYLDPGYFPVIEKLLDRGVFFCAASGRQYASLCKLFAPLWDRIFYITENGAQVVYKNETLLYRPMSLEVSRELVRDTRNIPGAECFYTTRKMAYFEKKDAHVFQLMSEKMLFDCMVVDSFLEISEPCMKFSLYHPTHVEQVTAKSFIPKWSRTHEVACGGKYFMDVMEKQVNKGSALSFIQRKLGILPSETMVFGDNENDLEMFSCAAYSYAVANARPEVRSKAAYLADTNEELGVLRVLKTI